MTAFFHFFAQSVKTEYDAAAVVRLVEKPGLLVGGQLSQRVLDKLFVRARVIVALLAVEILDARGRDRATVRMAPVLTRGGVLLERRSCGLYSSPGG
jgi:hypothetical protein